MAFSEIEPFPCAVLKERFPDVPNLGDVTEIEWRKFARKHGKPDLVVGGSPCQSFSVAGNREGLEGASGLMWEYVRAVRELKPGWVVWENVPGALSSTHGEDFRCLLESLDALGYGLAWRVLDAQFFGVAQRRERLFLVGHLGDTRACEVLFEPDCLRWDPPSSREKRQELAAGTGGGASCAGFAWHHGGNTGLGWSEEASATVESNTPPAVLAFAANQRGEVRLQGGDGSVTGAIPANQSGKQVNGVLCMGSQQGGAAVFDDMAQTLTGAAGTSGNNQPVVCMSDAAANAAIDRELAGTLKANNDRNQPIVIDCRNDAVNGEVSGTLQAKSNGGHSLNYVNPVMNNGIVRRLTPCECERLQGFPDDWTLIPYRGKPAGECPDTPRYKALGNSMAVPVMRWIGERIEAAKKSDERNEK